MSDEELDRKYLDLKTELFNLRFQNATGQLDNPIRLREVRRDIARVKTVQRMRELALAPGSPAAPEARRGERRGAAR
jgi:large subunit ribosomal protein L29